MSRLDSLLCICVMNKHVGSQKIISYSNPITYRMRLANLVQWYLGVILVNKVTQLVLGIGGRLHLVFLDLRSHYISKVAPNSRRVVASAISKTCNSKNIISISTCY